MMIETASNPTLETKFPDAKLLLHPTIPPPLHGINPRTILGQKWWDEQRKDAYEKYDFHCHACGIHRDDSFGISGRLDAHERYEFDFTACVIRLDGIVALCTICHAYIHRNRMHALFDKGIIGPTDCWEIIEHGERVLYNAGYDPKKFFWPPFDDADWHKWHLQINFYTRFKDRQDWLEHYKEE